MDPPVARFLDDRPGSPAAPLLTADFAQCPQRVPGLQVALWAHQRAVVQAAIDTEDAQQVTCRLPGYDHVTWHPVQVRTAALVIPDTIGMKTIVLAWCLLRPIPKPVVCQLSTLEASAIVCRNLGRRQTGPTSPARGYQAAPTAEHTTWIMATLIIVPLEGRTVPLEGRNAGTSPQSRRSWVAAITQQTMLRALVIAGAKDLGKLAQARGYDLVVCAAFRGVVPAICAETRGAMWARVIYDVDCCDTKHIPAAFTALLARGNEVTVTDPLLPLFTLKCCATFAQRSAGLPDVNYITHHLSTPADLGALLGAVGRAEMTKLLAEDVASAADLLGVKVTDVDALGHRLAGTHRATAVALQRARAAAADGECQVCLAPLDDPTAPTGVFVAKCCGTITCEMCGVAANRITAKRNLRGFCCHCKLPIVVSDLIYVGADVDIGGLCSWVADPTRLATPATTHQCVVWLVQSSRESSGPTIICATEGSVQAIREEMQRAQVAFQEPPVDCRTDLVWVDSREVRVDPPLTHPYSPLEGRSRGTTFLVTCLPSRLRGALPACTSLIFVPGWRPEEKSALIGRCQRPPRVAPLTVHYIW